MEQTPKYLETNRLLKYGTPEQQTRIRRYINCHTKYETHTYYCNEPYCIDCQRRKLKRYKDGLTLPEGNYGMLTISTIRPIRPETILETTETLKQTLNRQTRILKPKGSVTRYDLKYYTNANAYRPHYHALLHTETTDSNNNTNIITTNYKYNNKDNNNDNTYNYNNKYRKYLSDLNRQYITNHWNNYEDYLTSTETAYINDYGRLSETKDLDGNIRIHLDHDITDRNRTLNYILKPTDLFTLDRTKPTGIHFNLEDLMKYYPKNIRQISSTGTLKRRQTKRQTETKMQWHPNALKRLLDFILNFA